MGALDSIAANILCPVARHDFAQHIAECETCRASLLSALDAAGKEFPLLKMFVNVAELKKTIEGQKNAET